MLVNLNIGGGVDIDAQTVITGRGCVIGQSGSGKSYLVGVIVEELCKNNLPFVIVDTEGEYKSLKGMFNAIWVGDEKGADVGLDVDYTRLFAESIDKNVPVIFDVSEAMDKQSYVYKALSALYSLEEERRSPYLVVIEETDKFAPQIVRPRVNAVEEISVRGRKRGIGLLVATQRPANVSKNVLAQCGYGFIGKLSIDNDIKAVSILFEDKKRLAEIPDLKTGTFMSFGLQNDGAIRVKKRTVEHGGGTPLISLKQKTEIKMDKLIKELKGADEIGVRVAARSKKQKMPVTQLKVPVLNGSLTVEDAKEKAAKELKKQFILFGQQVEKVDSVEPKYLEAMLCRVRMPTARKGEYEEGSFVISNESLVTFANSGLRFSRVHIEKPVSLSAEDEKVLAAVSLGKADMPRIAKLTGLKFDSIARVLSRLKRARLVEQEKEAFKTRSYKSYSQRQRFETSDVMVPRESIINFDPRQQKNIELLLSNILPGAKAVSLDPLYIPVYEITLRQGEKVRVFSIDGIYGSRI